MDWTTAQQERPSACSYPLHLRMLKMQDFSLTLLSTYWKRPMSTYYSQHFKCFFDFILFTNLYLESYESVSEWITSDIILIVLAQLGLNWLRFAGRPTGRPNSQQTHRLTDWSPIDWFVNARKQRHTQWLCNLNIQSLFVTPVHLYTYCSG